MSWEHPAPSAQLQEFWRTWEHLLGMAKGRSWGRRDGDGYHCSLLAARGSFYFFHITRQSLQSIPLSKRRREFSILVKPLLAWRFQVFLVLVSQFAHHGSGITEFDQWVLFQRGFAFKVILRRSLQLHLKSWPPPTRQPLHWGVFWRDGLDFSNPFL